MIAAMMREDALRQGTLDRFTAAIAEVAEDPEQPGLEFREALFGPRTIEVPDEGEDVLGPAIPGLRMMPLGILDGPRGGDQ